MKCQILFSGKNKKNISKCRLLKILPRVLSVKTSIFTFHIWHNDPYFVLGLIFQDCLILLRKKT